MNDQAIPSLGRGSLLRPSAPPFRPALPPPWSSLLATGVLVLLTAAGCVTKGAAKKRAEQAFAAGRQEALEAVQREQNPVVTILGEVRQHVVPWTETLTLSQAISEAQYTGMRDPRAIILIREGVRITIDIRRYLRGQIADPRVLPADVIDLQR